VFAYIKGALAEATPIHAIIDTGTIGYKVFIPASVFTKLPQIQSQVLLHTSFIIRENSQALYGFLSPNERDLFEALLNVSGIGPKLSMSLIGHLPPEDLHAAISNHDVNRLSKVPGVGKKIAERLIIEMKDKLSALFSSEFISHATSMLNDPRAQKISDAMSALINLGYNQMTAQKAIKKTLKEQSDTIDLSTLITGALTNV